MYTNDLQFGSVIWSHKDIQDSISMFSTVTTGSEIEPFAEQPSKIRSRQSPEIGDVVVSSKVVSRDKQINTKACTNIFLFIHNHNLLYLRMS